MPADVVDILYSVIDEIGREKIRAEVSSSIEQSKKYCDEIIEKCSAKLSPEANDESLAKLCEALLHFMLTASLLPSERKVALNGVELDIVVPSLKMLAKSPDKSLVIQIIKTGDVGITQAESVQPNKENIWVVSARQLQTGHRNYHLGSEGGQQYSRIISDIHAFLADKGVKGLKMLHG